MQIILHLQSVDAQVLHCFQFLCIVTVAWVPIELLCLLNIVQLQEIEGVQAEAPCDMGNLIIFW